MKIRIKVIGLFLQTLICVVMLFFSNCVSIKTKQLDDVHNCIKKIQVELNRKIRLNYDFDGTYTYRVLIKDNEMKELNVNKQDELMVEIFQSIERIVKPVLVKCTSSEYVLNIVLNTESDPAIKVYKIYSNIDSIPK